MALPTITLNNQTVSSINLAQLNIDVPGSGSFSASDFNFTWEILNDEQLQSELAAGNLTVTYNGVTLTVEQSKAKILPQQALDILHNLSAVTDPGATDDDSAGYSAGSFWINNAIPTSPGVWQCTDATNTSATWAFLGTNTRGSSVLIWGNGSIASSTTTRYLEPGFNDSTAPTNGTTNSRIRAPRDGRLRNIFVRQSSPSSDSDPVTYTVRLNGTPSALLVVVAGNVTNGSQTGITISVSEGDDIDIQVTKGLPVNPSVQDVEVSVEFI